MLYRSIKHLARRMNSSFLIHGDRWVQAPLQSMFGRTILAKFTQPVELSHIANQSSACCSNIQYPFCTHTSHNQSLECCSGRERQGTRGRYFGDYLFVLKLFYHKLSGKRNFAAKYSLEIASCRYTISLGISTYDSTFNNSIVLTTELVFWLSAISTSFGNGSLPASCSSTPSSRFLRL